MDLLSQFSYQVIKHLLYSICSIAEGFPCLLLQKKIIINSSYFSQECNFVEL